MFASKQVMNNKSRKNSDSRFYHDKLFAKPDPHSFIVKNTEYNSNGKNLQGKINFSTRINNNLSGLILSGNKNGMLNNSLQLKRSSNKSADNETKLTGIEKESEENITSLKDSPVKSIPRSYSSKDMIQRRLVARGDTHGFANITDRITGSSNLLSIASDGEVTLRGTCNPTTQAGNELLSVLIEIINATNSDSNIRRGFTDRNTTLRFVRGSGMFFGQADFPQKINLDQLELLGVQSELESHPGPTAGSLLVHEIHEAYLLQESSRQAGILTPAIENDPNADENWSEDQSTQALALFNSAHALALQVEARAAGARLASRRQCARRIECDSCTGFVYEYNDGRTTEMDIEAANGVILRICLRKFEPSPGGGRGRRRIGAELCFDYRAQAQVEPPPRSSGRGCGSCVVVPGRSRQGFIRILTGFIGRNL